MEKLQKIHKQEWRNEKKALIEFLQSIKII